MTYKKWKKTARLTSGAYLLKNDIFAGMVKRHLEAGHTVAAEDVGSELRITISKPMGGKLCGPEPFALRYPIDSINGMMLAQYMNDAYKVMKGWRW